MSDDDILKFENVEKLFSGVHALKGVSFSVKRGHVHALCGENGAGKSTLIKMLTGVHAPTSGVIYYNGEKLACDNPKHALSLGIAGIYQELNLIPSLSVAENIFVGNYPVDGKGMVDWRSMRSQAKELLDRLEVDINPMARVRSMGVAKKQIVEIAKALSRDARVLIMDEPTAAIPQKEIQTLYRIVNSLRDNGVTIIYISHHLDEIFELSDRITVLRDGEFIDTVDTKSIDENGLIKLMVGRELSEQYPYIPAEPGAPALEVDDVTVPGVLKNISFTLRRGEVLGIAGMVGSGRTEMLQSLFGVLHPGAGDIRINGAVARIRSPRDAIAAGIAYLPEERKTSGLVLQLSILDNIGLTNLKSISVRGIIRDGKLNRIAKEMSESIRIKTPSLRQKVKRLSGGNQQKVVLGKWFARQPDIYLFDEPTRGIDVGAKVEIYNLMNNLKRKGAALIMVSSELPEILGMSDRVLVMRQGGIVGELSREHATQEEIMKLAVGGAGVTVN